MRVGIVFHKDPYAPPAGIDLVRLRAIAGGLIRLGFQAEIVSPVDREGLIDDLIPVRTLDSLAEPGRYDLVKTCYHYSMELIGDYQGPVVSRIVRVVDEKLPERDEPFRDRLLNCQELIHKRSCRLALNNTENELRWRRFYGPTPRSILVPTGCPGEIPRRGRNPYPPGEKAMLFLGSLAADRMVSLINEAAVRLRGICRVHLVGKNKSRMYNCDTQCDLDPLIVDHGEAPHDEVWDFIRHADVGLALATGPHAFDNDVSKIVDYLRGGLPTLSEVPIINNELIRRTEYGAIFDFDDPGDLTAKAIRLLENPPVEKREFVMRHMAREHSWDRRAEIYANLFRMIARGG